MKITIVHSGRRKGSIRFEAEDRAAEGVDLKAAVMVLANNATGEGVIAAIEALGRLGYKEAGVRETKTQRVFIVRKAS